MDSILPATSRGSPVTSIITASSSDSRFFQICELRFEKLRIEVVSAAIFQLGYACDRLPCKKTNFTSALTRSWSRYFFFNAEQASTAF